MSAALNQTTGRSAGLDAAAGDDAMGILPGACVHARKLASDAPAVAGRPFSGKKLGAPRRHDWEPILDAWAAGETGASIEARLGLKTNLASAIAAAAFRAGDPRGASRANQVRPSGTREWHIAAVAEWNLGNSQSAIARRHGKAKPTLRALLRRLEHLLTRPLPIDRGEDASLDIQNLRDARIVKTAMAVAGRAKFAADLPAMIAEHGTIKAIAAATGHTRAFVALAGKEAGVVFLGRCGPKPKPKPKPARIRQPRAAKPMSDAQAARMALPIKAPKPKPVEAPHSGDPRLDRAWAILRKSPDADPFEVRARAGCELRQVYQIRAELREMRRAA